MSFAISLRLVLDYYSNSVSFLEDQNVTLISLGEHDDKRNESWAPVGEETVLAALERIVDSAHYPILITCNTGKHRTGENCCHIDVLRILLCTSVDIFHPTRSVASCIRWTVEGTR